MSFLYVYQAGSSVSTTNDPPSKIHQHHLMKVLGIGEIGGYLTTFVG